MSPYTRHPSFEGPDQSQRQSAGPSATGDLPTGAGCQDLAPAALVASGAPVERLPSYLAKLDALQSQIEEKFHSSQAGALRKAEAAFRWLWITKPTRYQRGGTFRLHQVLEAQLDPRQKTVGNCLGLTVLYTCLAQRAGLACQAAYFPNAYGQGPHVISMVLLGDGTALDVDSSLPYGFGFSRLSTAVGRLIWDNAALVSDIYTSAGNELLNRGECLEALEHYKRVLALYPQHPSAALNAGIALVELGQGERAEAVFRGEVTELVATRPGQAAG